MAAHRNLHLAAILLAALAPLGGCITKRAAPQVSQAVLDARARSVAPAPQPCAPTPLAEISPVSVGFAFEAATLPDLNGHPLVAAARWLACHPGTAVVVSPDADAHGTASEQDALARRRAEAVQSYLVAQGVAPALVKLLPRGAAVPAGEHLLVLAEGRRW